MEYRKINLSVSDATSNGWNLAKKYGLLLAVIYLGISLIGNCIGSMFAPTDFWQDYIEAVQNQDVDSLLELGRRGYGALYYVGSTLQWIVDTALLAGFISIILKLTKGTLKSVSLTPYAMNVMTYIKYFGVSIIYGLIVAVGFLLCIFPGIWLGVKLSFAHFYILDHPDKSIGDALKASWNITKGNWWSLFGLCWVEIGVMLLGFCCCCVGFYFAVPFAYFIDADAYYTLLAQYEYEEPATETFEETIVEPAEAVIEQPAIEPVEEPADTTAEEDSYNKDEK